ncbi:hypothetical protein BV898_11250 [Hypsibius exemplaris]|uniref:Uncharacterized protein n=1 Tax=Hypsibius exemplaris TaxID=2072580 RepID=A0A1W0WH59_HYPEX|nr:hypothetical protein BV898_11250 [Hypsibius exemplaris]
MFSVWNAVAAFILTSSATMARGETTPITATVTMVAHNQTASSGSSPNRLESCIRGTLTLARNGSINRRPDDQIGDSNSDYRSPLPQGRLSTQLPIVVPKPTLPPALSAKSQKQLVLDLQKSFEIKAAGPSDAINPVKYVQHNLSVRNGLAVFLPQDGNYVFAHTDYFFCGESSAAFDIYRFEDGMMAKHWDNVRSNSGPNLSGRTMFCGPDYRYRADPTTATVLTRLPLPC